MPSRKTSQELIDQLISVLPEQFSKPGKKKAIIELRIRLANLSLTLREEGTLAELPDSFWIKTMDNLIKSEKGNKKSRETQRRYAFILREIASIWKEKGWINTLPELKTSPQHPRRLTVRVDLLRGQMYSNYLKLLSAFILPFTGKIPGRLVPDGLVDNHEAYLALGMILSGVCRERAIAQLKELRWGDIPLHTNFPIAMPHPRRQQYYWFWPLRLPRLLLESYRQRWERCRAEETVFKSANLTDKVHDLLTSLCKLAGIPKMSIEQLIYLTRLHLCQYISNPMMAIWLGLIPFRPRPVDQLSDRFSLEDLKLEIPLLTPQFPSISEGDSLNQEEMGAYADDLAEIKEDLEILFSHKRPKTAIEYLEGWIQDHSWSNHIPTHNLCLLLGWLLAQVEKPKISPQSRKVYWLALKRIWKRAPMDKIESFQKALFDDFVSDEDYSLSSRRLSMRVWHSLIGYCHHLHIKMSIRKLPKVVGKVDTGPVRIITTRQIRDLYLKLDHIEEKVAVYLAYRLCLRVSEVCNLLSGDFYFGEQPFVYVVDSKFGKNRRVDLSYLSIEELERLRSLVDHRLRQSGPQSYLLITHYGRKLIPESLSANTKKVMASLGLCDVKLVGQPVSFHSLRRQGLNDIYRITHDLRTAAFGGGHSLVLTTTGSYMSDLDLEGVEKMINCPHLLNNPEIYIPLLTLASLSDKSDRRLAQRLGKLNSEGPENKITVFNPKNTPDGIRPTRAGRQVEYVSLMDALRLIY